MRCHAIGFEGDITAGQSFAREVGGGLMLKFMPQNFGDAKTVLSGWHVELAPTAQTGPSDGAKDFIYPVNPPLRFNPWQDIGTSYGIAAEKKLQHTIAYAFILDARDYRRIEAAMNDALWPYSAHDPKNADERYFATLSSLELGDLRLVPLQVIADKDGQAITRLRFRVEVVSPNRFKFSPSFADHASACPRRQ